MIRILLAIYFFTTGLSISAQSYERYKPLSDTTIISSALGYERKIRITVPSEYQDNIPEQSFPLIIIFDSQNKRSYHYILNTIDYLTSNEQMPSSTIIGVESTQQNRYLETQLTINDSLAKGDQNEQFIFEELIPLAKSKYKASDFVVLIGHSRYGYFTTYLLTKQPERLNAVIALSPFLTELNVDLTDSIEQLYHTFSSARQLYYRYGIGRDYPEDFQKLNEKIAEMKDINHLVDARGMLFDEADHNVTPGLTIGSALYDVFEYWSHQQNFFLNNDNQRLDILPDLLNKIKMHYGQELAFALGTLNGKGWYFFNEGLYEKAISAWEIMLGEYPNYSEGYLYIIYAQQELKQDITGTLQKLKESLKRTAFYSDEEIKEILEEIETIER